MTILLALRISLEGKCRVITAVLTLVDTYDLPPVLCSGFIHSCSHFLLLPICGLSALDDANIYLFIMAFDLYVNAQYYINNFFCSTTLLQTLMSFLRMKFTLVSDINDYTRYVAEYFPHVFSTMLRTSFSKYQS